MQAYHYGTIKLGNRNYSIRVVPDHNATVGDFNYFLIQALKQYTSDDDVNALVEYLYNIQAELKPGRKLVVESDDISIPLYDNHAHMGGSIEPETVAALLSKNGHRIRLGQVRKNMTYQGKKPGNFNTFIEKFRLLEQVQWTEEDVYDCVHQIVSRIDMDGVDGSEIRFSIGKYRPYLKMSDIEIIKLIKQAFDDASAYFNVKINLVLSIKHGNKFEELEVAYKLPEYTDCVVGIDTSGDERLADMSQLKAIYDLWGAHGKILMIHAGEQPSTGHNVRKAIEMLNVSRIGHGIYADRYTLDLAKDKNVCFDLAISSNYYTGVVKHRHRHPAIKMIENGNIVTIGTDDASVFCTSLRKEYALAKVYWGLSDSDITQLKLNAVNYSSFGGD